MNNKEICAMLSDFISVAERPVCVNGGVYKERSGNVYMPTEVRDGILELMAQSFCRKTKFGEYECYEKTKNGIGVDGCLVGEINKLNNAGITTIGCCCGHGKRQGFIQVSQNDVNKMRDIGYTQIDIDDYGNGKWCFIPKTKLPSTPDCDIAHNIESCDECGFCNL